MPFPFFIYNKRELRFTLVIFILGIIIGTLLLNIIVSKKLDILILDNNKLKNNCQEKDLEINELKSNLKEQKKHFIQKLSIEINSDLNQHTEQKIEKKIKDLLSGLIGENYKNLDPLLLRNIIHQRYLMVEDKTYHLELDYIVISEELKIFVKISKNKEENSEP